MCENLMECYGFFEGWSHRRDKKSSTNGATTVKSCVLLPYNFIVEAMHGSRHSVSLHTHQDVTQAWGWWPMLEIQITRPSKKTFLPPNTSKAEKNDGKRSLMKTIL